MYSTIFFSKSLMGEHNELEHISKQSYFLPILLDLSTVGHWCKYRWYVQNSEMWNRHSLWTKLMHTDLITNSILCGVWRWWLMYRSIVSRINSNRCTFISIYNRQLCGCFGINGCRQFRNHCLGLNQWVNQGVSIMNLITHIL